jgi:hypothetical protein
MKYLSVVLFFAFGSCTTIKLSIPAVFREQATVFHVSGAKKNRMSFAGYKTSRIHRGMHVTYPGRSGDYVPENILLNKVGLQKDVTVVNERAGFRYTLFDGDKSMEIYGQEKSSKRSTEFSIMHSASPLSSYKRPEESKYIFSSVIKIDTGTNSRNWDLVMSNFWERENDPVKSIFTFIPRDDYGYASNGTDSIFIHPISLRNTESANGRQGNLPFRMLSGYELSTNDGVIAIIDLIHADVWLYNDLDEKDRLMVAGITTALFARKVNETQW